MAIVAILKRRTTRAAITLSLAYYFSNEFPLCSNVLTVFGAFQLIYAYYRSLAVTPKGRSVVITGCDSGFGHSLALKLHKMEFTVFACCLDKNSSGATTLTKLGKETGRLHVIQVNITNQQDVDEARRYVVNNLTEKDGLWGLVNNAGIVGTMGFAEWLEIEDYEKNIAVNLIGMIRVTKAFMPLIRKRQGRIVNVSSVLGRSTSYGSGGYSITKFAVEAFSDVLRNEMRPFNVKVVIIEPGNFINATNVLKGNSQEAHIAFNNLVHSTWRNCHEDIQKDYGIQSLEHIKDSGKLLAYTSGKDVSIVVDAMVDGVYRLYPKDRYLQAFFIDKLFILIYCYLPSFLADTFSACLINTSIWILKKYIF